MKFKDYTNQKFFSLTLTKPYRYENRIGWHALCDCGKKVKLKNGHISQLKNGRIKSCGCSKAKRLSIHGGWKEGHKLYGVWRSMRSRCICKSNTAYKYYGGRGIMICPTWLGSYSDFKKWALDNGYKEGLTIDRINNDGNYSPKNCRWVTRAENNRNRIHWTKK